MGDVSFGGVVVAVGDQISAGGFGFPNSTVAGLTTPLTLSDGIILGDAESGDAESGVVLPNIAAIRRKVSDVPSSFTKQADSFQKADVTGFTVSWVFQGNGEQVTSTPALGECGFETAFPGIEALLDSMGLIGANGTAPIQTYKPRYAASADGATIYTTWKIFVGDLAYVFSDCLVESAEFAFTPGGNCVLTANVLVGTFDTTTVVDGFTFPVISDSYGNMASLAAPLVEGVGFSWGAVRGFENLTVTIENVIEKFADSNVDVSGERQVQTGRLFKVNGTLYVDGASAGSEFEFQNVVNTSAPTVDMFFQVGTIAGGDDIANAFKIELKKLQASDIKYNRIGDALVVELNDAHCTGTGVGEEFILTMN